MEPVQREGHLARRGRASQAARGGRLHRVGDCGRRDVARVGQVARTVESAHGVALRADDVRVDVRRDCSEARDLRAATVDLVARDADVVGRGVPQQRDLAGTRGRPQVARDARLLSVGNVDRRGVARVGEVARCVDRTHRVVGVARLQARVGEGRDAAERGADLDAAAVHAVAGDTHVVRGACPAQHDLARAGDPAQVAGRGGLVRVGHDSGRDVARVREVARGVEGAHRVAVRPGRKARLRVGRGDAEARDLIAGAVDLVAGDTDVVGRGVPQQGHLARARRGAQVARHARLRAVGHGHRRGVAHVGEVPGCVHCTHGVAVLAGGEAGVREGSDVAEHAADLGAAAVHAVAGDAHVVGGGVPGERDLARGPRAVEVARRRRLVRVGHRRGGDVARVGQVARGVDRPHGEAVRTGGEARLRVRSGVGVDAGDLVLTAVDAVARDADVVAGGVPVECDLARRLQWPAGSRARSGSACRGPSPTRRCSRRSGSRSRRAP